MASKNNRIIPSDSLWRPTIHDLAPVVKFPKAKKKSIGYRNKLVKQVRLAAGLPDGKAFEMVRMAALCLELTVPDKKAIETHVDILESYLNKRNWHFTKRTPAKRSLCFYKTPEWRKLRYKIIVRYGRRCMACGCTDQVIHVDHIKPRSKYPELELCADNLQILCEDCNLGKSNIDQTDWR